jgi:hypothetical protein
LALPLSGRPLQMSSSQGAPIASTPPLAQ